MCNWMILEVCFLVGLLFNGANSPCSLSAPSLPNGVWTPLHTQRPFFPEVQSPFLPQTHVPDWLPLDLRVRVGSTVALSILLTLV